MHKIVLYKPRTKIEWTRNDIASFEWRGAVRTVTIVGIPWKIIQQGYNEHP